MRHRAHRPSILRSRTGLAVLATIVALVASVGSAQARDRDRHSRHDHRHGHGRVVHVDRHPTAPAHVRRGHFDRHRSRIVVHDYGRFEPVRVRHRTVVRHADRFVVPVRLDDAYRYPEYYYGRVYHAGHRHWHPVYRYPVYGAVGVTWTPYDYCDGHVHASGFFGYDGPRFSVRIGF